MHIIYGAKGVGQNEINWMVYSSACSWLSVPCWCFAVDMMKHVVGHFVHIALLLKQVGLVSRLLVHEWRLGPIGRPATSTSPPCPTYLNTSTPNLFWSSSSSLPPCHLIGFLIPVPSAAATSELNINNEHRLKVIFCFQFCSGAILSSADETLWFTEAVASLCPPWPWRSSPLASLITAS